MWVRINVAERNGKIYERRQNAKRFKALTPDTIRLDELAGNWESLSGECQQGIIVEYSGVRKSWPCEFSAWGDCFGTGNPSNGVSYKGLYGIMAVK